MTLRIDVKDMIYQIMGIAHAVIPDTSGITFFYKDEIPNQVGNDIMDKVLFHVLRPE